MDTREPGGTAVGDRIRAALFECGEHGILGLTEAFLVNAARAQHVRELLLPALAAGKLVLSDRYVDATLAYQGYGRGVELDTLRQLVAIASAGLAPDLTLYLDVPVEVGLARKAAGSARGEELNQFDRLEVDFHRRVAAGYRALIAAEPARWRVVDATPSVALVQQRLRAALEPVLPAGALAQ